MTREITSAYMWSQQRAFKVKQQSLLFQCCIDTVKTPSVLYMLHICSNRPTDGPSHQHTPAVMEGLVRGSVQGRNTGENRQGRFVAPSHPPPSFMYQQHMGAKWGQCTLQVFARTHTRLDRQSWPGDEEKGDASINRCLMLLFWRGLCFFSPPFEIHGFLCAVVLHVWLRNALPFWQLFIYLQVLGVRGPGASGTRAEGLTSLEWLCGLNVDPWGFCLTVSSRCSVVACGAMSTTPSTKSIARTQWRGDSTSGIYLCLAGMENK